MRGFTVHIDDTVPIEALSQSAPAAGQAPAVAATGGHTSVAPAPVSEAENSENVHRSGQMVDRYRITKLIAMGGTSRVYEAVHQFTNKPVALKVMRHRLAKRSDVVERFRQEAVVLASIRHDNVVAVENAGLTEDGRVFIAMELLRGRTLREHLRRSARLDQNDTVRLMTEVARGVSAAHQVGVAHRDLKPENIFCVTHGKVKVLDLGTAKYAGEHAPSIQTAWGKVVGTVAYVAPERFNGEPGDVRSDIYALGLITYECLAGHHPMVPDGKWPNPTEIASRQVQYEPAPFAGVSPALWRIISKAIQKSPALRYQSALELQQALLEVEQHRQPATESVTDTLYGGLARRLIRPIVAGSVFGAVVAGSFHWHGTSRPISSAPSATGAPDQVAARLAATTALNARVPMPALLGSVAPPMLPQPSKSAAAAQSAVAVTRARPPENASGPLRRAASVTKSQVDSSQIGVAAADSVVGTKGPAGPVGKSLGDYDSSPPLRVPKDDLPASGL